MQTQGGSRFNQNYYQPPSYDSSPQQQSQSRFSSFPPSQPVNPTFGLASAQNPSLINPSIPPNQNAVFIVPKSNMASDSFTKKFFSDLEIQENHRKYNVRKDSTMYQFQSEQLHTIMKKFQSQFPNTMVQEIKRSEKQLENGLHPILRKIFYGTIIYWVMLRRFNFFKLTHNVPLKLTALIYCDLKSWALQDKQMRFFEDKAFANSQYFEKVIEKYGINNQSYKRLELASS